ncbi:MAG: hypothetical protein OWT27_04865, partial [Firmicutes bacterium]|nr:hypothetical protein [Bacillota bacterium]
MATETGEGQTGTGEGQTGTESFAAQMDCVRQRQTAKRRQQDERDRARKDRDQHAEARMGYMLRQARELFVQSDDRLWSDDAPAGQTGFVIRYAKNSESVRPAFAVQATLQQGTASLKVTDG